MRPAMNPGLRSQHPGRTPSRQLSSGGDRLPARGSVGPAAGARGGMDRRERRALGLAACSLLLGLAGWGASISGYINPMLGTALMVFGGVGALVALLLVAWWEIRAWLTDSAPVADPEFVPEDATHSGFTWESSYSKPGGTDDPRHFGQAIVTPHVPIQPVRLRIELSREPREYWIQMHDALAAKHPVPSSMIEGSMRLPDKDPDTVRAQGRIIEIDEREFALRPGRFLAVIAVADSPFEFLSIRRRNPHASGPGTS